MKGWQLGAVVVVVIALLTLFTHLFRPSVVGGPQIVSEDPTTGQLKPVPTPTPSNEPKKEIQGNTSVFTGHDPVDGKISWTLKATSIQMRDAEKKADARDIVCTFYSKEEQPMAVVTSSGCTINLNNNNLQFHGRVTAVDPAGQTLTVAHLRYDGKAKRFFGHGGVHMTRATSVITSDKVWADPTMKIVQLDGHVQAYVRTIAVATPAPVPPPRIPAAPSDMPSAISIPVVPRSSSTPAAPAPSARAGQAQPSAAPMAASPGGTR